MLRRSKSIALGTLFMFAVAAMAPQAFAQSQKLALIMPPPAGMTIARNGASNALALRSNPDLSPVFLRQVVRYASNESPGTIIVNTGQKYLYYIVDDQRAVRYGIGVAREGFEWSGTHRVTAKREWPSWTPPAEMRQRQPGLPLRMEGGPDNPLGARALYIGSTLYRIHGTNQPGTIGLNVSSGCIRMTNEDVVDLFGRAKIGAKVVVL